MGFTSLHSKIFFCCESRRGSVFSSPGKMPRYQARSKIYKKPFSFHREHKNYAPAKDARYQHVLLGDPCLSFPSMTSRRCHWAAGSLTLDRYVCTVSQPLINFFFFFYNIAHEELQLKYALTGSEPLTDFCWIKIPCLERKAKKKPLKLPGAGIEHAGRRLETGSHVWFRNQEWSTHAQRTPWCPPIKIF